MRRLFKFILIFSIILAIILSVATLLMFRYLHQYKGGVIDEKIVNARKNAGNTTLYAYNFYDRENRLGKEYILENFKIESRDKYIYVDFESIPKYLINAFISIEDKRFYQHHGVDFLRTGKAGINYVLKKSSSFGGSTITQQLVKNITGNSEKNIDRKIKEIFYAINFEKTHSKDEIMNMYLNIINLGNKKEQSLLFYNLLIVLN